MLNRVGRDRATPPRVYDPAVNSDASQASFAEAPARELFSSLPCNCATAGAEEGGVLPR